MSDILRDCVTRLDALTVRVAELAAILRPTVRDTPLAEELDRLAGWRCTP